MPLFYVYVYFSFILHIIYNCATTIWFSTIMHSYPHYPQSYPALTEAYIYAVSLLYYILQHLKLDVTHDLNVYFLPRLIP